MMYEIFYSYPNTMTITILIITIKKHEIILTYP